MKERLISAAAYLWILFFLPLVLIPGSSFGRFHANQALLNLLWGIACGLLTRLLGIIPVIGGILAWFFGLLIAVFPIWGIVCALLGKQKPFPIIGEIRILK